MKTAVSRIHWLPLRAVLLTVSLLSCSAASQATSLVGVNFSEASSHPTNWTPLPSVVSPVSDLLAEDGTPTEIDLSFAAMNLFSGTLDPNSVPLHSPSLGSLDGNVYGRFRGPSFIALFSDLAPNEDYLLWVIGARFLVPVSQNVQIFGSGPLVEFNQIGPADSLFINEELGDSSRSFESYAKTIHASDGGTIAIVVKGLSDADGQTYTVSGLAIQAVPEPNSIILAGIGVLAMGGYLCARHCKWRRAGCA